MKVVSVYVHILIDFVLFQIITTFSVVDNMKEQFYAEQAKISRCDYDFVNYLVYFLYISCLKYFFYILPHIIFHMIPENIYLACFYCRKDDPKIKELFNDIEKLRQEFESVERPILELETPTPKAENNPKSETPSPKAESPSGGKLQSGPSHLQKDDKGAHVVETGKHPKLLTGKKEQTIDPEAELAKLESEFGKDGRDYTTEEIGDWEFDELERELRSGN